MELNHPTFIFYVASRHVTLLHVVEDGLNHDDNDDDDDDDYNLRERRHDHTDNCKNSNDIAHRDSSSVSKYCCCSSRDISGIIIIT
jgi:hypothetical protein